MKIQSKLILTGMLLLVGACGSNSDSGTGGGNPPNNGNGNGNGNGGNGENNGGGGGNNNPNLQPASCEDQWKTFQSQFQVGEFQTWRVRTFSPAVATTHSSETMTRTKVEAVSDTKIIQSTEITLQGRTTSNADDFTKESFMEGCNRPVTSTSTPETGDETITVPAGTFTTKWIRTKSEEQGRKTAVTIWEHTLPSGDHLLVKMESQSEGDIGGTAFDIRSLQELMETNKK